MDINILKQKKYFIIDMDGTFYLGNQILEGSLDFIAAVKNSGKDFLFFTNNSSIYSALYVDKLSKMGLDVGIDKVITSGMVTARHLKNNYAGANVYLVGTPALEEYFLSEGISLVDDNPDVVVIGYDTTLTYEKLSNACTYIRKGAAFIASHPDLNCPTENGSVPDCGAMCALITASTGVKPTYLGKPYTSTLEYILNHLKCTKEDIVFIGDRLSTDIAIGYNHGVTTILVLTGETQLHHLEASEIKPTFVFERLSDLNNLL